MAFEPLDPAWKMVLQELDQNSQSTLWSEEVRGGNGMLRGLLWFFINKKKKTPHVSKHAAPEEITLFS